MTRAHISARRAMSAIHAFPLNVNLIAQSEFGPSLFDDN